MKNNFKLKNIYSQKTAPFLAGVLLGIGFIFPFYWFLSLVGIFVAIDLFRFQYQRISLVLGWMILWFIKSAMALSWVWSVYPIGWVEFSNKFEELLIVCVYWLSGALWFSVGGLAVGLILYKIFNSQLPKKYFYWLVAPVWLMGELFGAIVFSFFTLGPGASLQPYMSFGMLGYLFGVTELGVFLSRWGGVWVLTLLLVGGSTYFYYLLSIKKVTLAKKLVVVVALIFCLAQLFFPFQKFEKSGQTVVGLNTNFLSAKLITNESYTKKIEIISDMVDKAVDLNPDYIVLPEDSRYFESKFSGMSTSTAMNYFSFLHPNSKTILVDSGRVDMPNGEAVLRANIFDNQTHRIYQFDKQYLTPQGEYIPYLYAAVAFLFGFGEEMNQVAKDISYRPGPFEQDESLPANIPGVLFCLESIQSGRVSDLKSFRQLPFIAHPVSHGWFHDSKILQQQLEVMLRIQSRYNQVPIVSAGNLVVGKAYLPNGGLDLGEVVLSGEKWQAIEYKI